MKKRLSIIEVLVVIVIVCMLVALILPAVNVAMKATERARQQLDAVSVVTESGSDFQAGDIAYLMLDGRRVQVTSVNIGGTYCVRYSDDLNRLEEIILKPFELAEERPLLEVKDDTFGGQG